MNDALPERESRIPEPKRLQATGNEEVLSVLPGSTAARAERRKVPRFDFGERVIAQIPGSAEGPSPIVTRKGDDPMLLEGIAYADESDFRIVFTPTE